MRFRDFQSYFDNLLVRVFGSFVRRTKTAGAGGSADMELEGSLKRRGRYTVGSETDSAAEVVLAIT